MDININHLKYFYDTFKLGSVNEAAKVNYVSQPAISQGIRKLELQLDLKLLDHKRNSISPTTDSLYLINEIRGVFDSIEVLQAKIDRLKNKVSGVLRVGVSVSLAKALIIPKLADFEKKYPQVELKIKVGKTSYQIHQLSANEIDLGITIDNGNLNKFYSKPICHGQFILVDKRSRGKSDLKKLRILTTEDRPEVEKLHQVFKKMSSTNHNIVESSHEVESWDLLYDMAKQGLGSALIPDFMIKPEDKLIQLNKKIKLPRMDYSVVAISNKQSQLSSIAELFLSHLG